MSQMHYLDFDIVIEPAGDGYTARVFNSPGGQASTEFRAPFSDLEIENFLLRVGRTRHAVRRIESPEMASAKVFGGQLFNGAFGGDVRGCLRSSLDEAARQGAGLRVRLHLAKAPALSDLPWEFLYNASMNRFLGLSVETPVVRYLDLPERIRPLVVKPPLRLLMMISSPSDYPRLDVEREAEKLNEALGDLEKQGLVIVERLATASLAELQRRLRSAEYHIFHFVGHGGFNAQEEDGVLVLEEPDKRGRRVSAQYLGTLLHDHRPLRLAVLNACEGARSSRNDPFSGTAQSLIQQGIPAVIAMQFEVTDDAAICFTREFYSAIAVGYPVDAALAESRKAIFAEVSEIEWGTPVLYMRTPDGRIFDVEQISAPDRAQRQVASIFAAAQAASAAGDDAGTLAKLSELLAIEPAHAQAQTLLRETNASLERAAQARRDAEARASEERAREAQAQEARDAAAKAAERQLAEQRVADARAAESRAAAAREAELRETELAKARQLEAERKPLDGTTRGLASAPRGRRRDLVLGGVAATVIMLTIGTIAKAQWDRYLQDKAKGAALQRVVGDSSAMPRNVQGDTALPAQGNKTKGSLVTPLPSAPTAATIPNDADPSAMRPATASQQRELQNVIQNVDRAIVQTFQTLDPRPLYSVFSGQALSTQLSQLNTLISNGAYAKHNLLAQRFEEISTNAKGDRAEVRYVERWNSYFFSRLNGACVNHFHDFDLPQTAFLQRSVDGWKIYATTQYAATPTLVPCD